MPDRATHCPGCGIPITDWEQVTGTYVVIWPCGCWITTEQASSPGTASEPSRRTVEWIPLRAVTTVERGQDFPVVWVCDDEEWESATDGCRPEGAIPWPAESIEEAKQ